MRFGRSIGGFRQLKPFLLAGASIARPTLPVRGKSAERGKGIGGGIGGGLIRRSRVGGESSPTPPPPTTDVIIAALAPQTGTSAGVQTFTSPTLGTKTAPALLVLQNTHNTANDGSSTTGCGAGVGLSRSTGFQRSTYTSSWHARPRTAVIRRLDEFDAVYMSYPNSTSLGIKDGDWSPVSGGVEFNPTTNTGWDVRLPTMAFAGDDVTAFGAQVNLGTTTAALDQNTLGFTPDVVVGFGMNGAANGQSFFNFVFGFALADGTQRCVSWSEANDIAAGNPRQCIHTDAIHSQINSNDGTLSYKTIASDFDEAGYSLTSSASTASDAMMALALKFEGCPVAIVDFDTPITTGLHTIGGAGFTPQAAIVVMTALEETDPTFPLTNNDTMSGLGIAFIADQVAGCGWRIDSGANPTSTATTSGPNVFHPSATNVRAGFATFDAWVSGGVRLNWSAVQTTAKKGFALLIGPPA